MTSSIVLVLQIPFLGGGTEFSNPVGDVADGRGASAIAQRQNDRKVAFARSRRHYLGLSPALRNRESPD
ncbi:MAG: hypothetical protein GY719_05250 [bacterium]|nr:hypothetical protein [bacterium]